MMKKKTGNILLVSNYPSNTKYAWWLMEHFWLLLANIAKKEESNAYLAYPKINTLPESIKNSSIKTCEMVIPWKNSQQKYQIIEFIKERNISTIYFTDKPFFNVKYALLRLAGIKKIIIHDHTPGDRPEITGFRGLLKSLRNTMSLFTADAVINVSKSMRTRSIKNGKTPPHKCFSVQNGISPVAFNKDRNKIRQELNIPDESIIAITTGRAHPYKRFDLILEAASLLAKSHSDKNLIYVFVGDGPALKALKVQSKKLALENKVKFLGLRNDVKDLLGASDFAIHAALGEGFSLSIIEYMGSGLPVLVPDIPSVKQAITHDKNGYIYSKNSSQDMAKYIIKLASDKALRYQLGQKAKQDALNSYSLDKCTKEFITTIYLALT